MTELAFPLFPFDTFPNGEKFLFFTIDHGINR